MKKIFSALLPALFVTLLTGCDATLQKLNEDLAKVNQALSGKPATNTQPVPAQQSISTTNASPVVSAVQTALTIPTDTRTKDAMEAALPIIKKILSIHACVKVDSGMLQMNFHTVPGVSWDGSSMNFNDYPNSAYIVKFHDRTKCMSVKAIDGWAMPALNALQFRAVFFADDSGESSNFTYLMKRIDDSTWKLQQAKRSY
jgi:hypothetical protein